MDAILPPATATRRRQVSRDVIISVRDLVVGFGERIILNHLALDVYRGEILGFVGTSGGGKSVLTRTILGLVPKVSGTVEVFGQDLDTLSERERSAPKAERWYHASVPSLGVPSSKGTGAAESPPKPPS